MRKRNLHRLTAACAATVLALASCSSDDAAYTAPDGLLRFQAGVRQELTRTASATPYAGPAFGLIGYAFDSWQQTLTPDYLYDEETERRGEHWTTVTPRYWPDGPAYARFYAYAPYGATGLTLSGRTMQGPPTLTYTVAPELRDQQDLVLAATGDVACEPQAEVSLVFSHLLTGVKFAEGRIRSGLVTGITIRGVRNQGTYKTGQKSWENQTGQATFGQDVHYTTGSQGDDIMADKAFLMMPQNVPAGAVIEVTIEGQDENGDDKTYTLNASIGGQVWHAGDWLSYRINADAVVIYRIDTDPVIIPWDNVTEDIMYFLIQGSPWISAWDKGYSNSEAVDYNIIAGQPNINSWGGSEDDNNIDYRLIGAAASIKCWQEALATGVDYSTIVARHIIQGWNDGSDGKGGNVDYNTMAGQPQVDAWGSTDGTSVDYNTMTGKPDVSGWQDDDDENVNM